MQAGLAGEARLGQALPVREHARWGGNVTWETFPHVVKAWASKSDCNVYLLQGTAHIFRHLHTATAWWTFVSLPGIAPKTEPKTQPWAEKAVPKQDRRAVLGRCAGVTRLYYKYNSGGTPGPQCGPILGPQCGPIFGPQIGSLGWKMVPLLSRKLRQERAERSRAAGGSFA